MLAPPTSVMSQGMQFLSCGCFKTRLKRSLYFHPSVEKINPARSCTVPFDFISQSPLIHPDLRQSDLIPTSCILDSVDSLTALRTWNVFTSVHVQGFTELSRCNRSSTSTVAAAASWVKEMHWDTIPSSQQNLWSGYQSNIITLKQFDEIN